MAQMILFILSHNKKKKSYTMIIGVSVGTFQNLLNEKK